MRRLVWALFAAGIVLVVFPRSAQAQYFEWVVVNGVYTVVPMDISGLAGFGGDGKCKLDDCKGDDPFAAAKSPWAGCNSKCENPCKTTACPSVCSDKATCQACCGAFYRRIMKECGGGAYCHQVHDAELTTCNTFCDPDRG